MGTNAIGYENETKINECLCRAKYGFNEIEYLNDLTMEVLLNAACAMVNAVVKRKIEKNRCWDEQP